MVSIRFAINLERSDALTSVGADSFGLLLDDFFRFELRVSSIFRNRASVFGFNSE